MIEIPQFIFTPQAIHLLPHNGDCQLLGIAPDGTIYIEETYGDGWMAQHAIAPDGSIAATQDEAEGAVTLTAPLELPPGSTFPRTVWNTMHLNFAGPRHRGLREPERVAEGVRSLAIPDRLWLPTRLGVSGVPIGVAESYVLAETCLFHPNIFFICRRVRIAYALAEARTDEDGQPFDYDTAPLYLAHLYDRKDDRPVDLRDLVGVPPFDALARPLDCLLREQTLVIADGGEGGRHARLHVWHVDPMPTPKAVRGTSEQKLYGG